MKRLILAFCCLFAITSEAEQVPPQAQEVLEYWFGPLSSVETYPEDKEKLWFGGGDAVDKEIRNRFESLVHAAADHQLDSWNETPKGRLALIIVLDQFPRNIYRGTPNAFAYDQMAQKLTLEGIKKGDDQALFPVEKIFFYLPLEHAENIDLQRLSVDKFNAIIPTVPAEHVASFESFVDYACRHHKVIAQFGRFPHRNKVLERISTPQEIEFLKDPKSSF